MSFIKGKEAVVEAAQHEFVPFLGMTAGTLLVCLCVAGLIEPYRFASAGVTGLALIPVTSGAFRPCGSSRSATRCC